MLVVTRKLGETVLIGDNVLVRVHQLKNGSVKLAIVAPRDVRLLRGELAPVEVVEAIGGPVEEVMKTAAERMLEMRTLQVSP